MKMIQGGNFRHLRPFSRSGEGWDEGSFHAHSANALLTKFIIAGRFVPQPRYNPDESRIISLLRLKQILSMNAVN